MSLDILSKHETHPDMFSKGATSPQNSPFDIDERVCHYTVSMRCNLYNSISAVVFFKLSFQTFRFLKMTRVLSRVLPQVFKSPRSANYWYMSITPLSASCIHSYLISSICPVNMIICIFCSCSFVLNNDVLFTLISRCYR